MPLFTEEELRARARQSLRPSERLFSANTIKSYVNESINKQRAAPSTKIYDIFLSHSTGDSDQVYGLKLELEDLGYSVYIDWIDDQQLDRSNVTKATADLLRERMKICKSLFFAYSVNATKSKWMPWELGYFDALKQKAAVLPIRTNETGNTDHFAGSEYISLYPYIVRNRGSDGKAVLYVHESAQKYIGFDRWLNFNGKLFQH